LTTYLTTDDLIVLLEELGGLQVRDLGLLDSAAHRPQATAFGDDAYPDLDTKAAVLLESIVRNHPLVDGNKRLAWVAVVVFYGVNRRALRAPRIRPTTWSSRSPRVESATRRWPPSSPSGWQKPPD